MDKLRSLLRTFNVIYTSRVFEEQLGVESLGEDLFVSLQMGLQGIAVSGVVYYISELQACRQLSRRGSSAARPQKRVLSGA